MGSRVEDSHGSLSWAENLDWESHGRLMERELGGARLRVTWLAV